MKTTIIFESKALKTYEEIIVLNSGDKVWLDGILYDVWYNSLDINDDCLTIVLKEPE